MSRLRCIVWACVIQGVVGLSFAAGLRGEEPTRVVLLGDGVPSDQALFKQIEIGFLGDEKVEVVRKAAAEAPAVGQPNRSESPRIVSLIADSKCDLAVVVDPAVNGNAATGFTIWDGRGAVVNEADFTSERDASRVEELAEAIRRARAEFVNLGKTSHRIAILTGFGEQEPISPIALDPLRLALEKWLAISDQLSVVPGSLDPLAPLPEADYLIVLNGKQVEQNQTLEVRVLDGDRKPLAKLTFDNPAQEVDGIKKISNEIAKSLGVAEFDKQVDSARLARRLISCGKSLTIHQQTLNGIYHHAAATVLVADDVRLQWELAASILAELYRQRYERNAGQWPPATIQSLSLAAFALVAQVYEKVAEDQKAIDEIAGVDTRTGTTNSFPVNMHLDSQLSQAREDKWPEDVVKQLAELRRTGIRSIFSKHRALAKKDLNRHSVYTEFMATQLRRFIDIGNPESIDDRDLELVFEMVRMWLRDFDELPAARQGWPAIRRGLTWVTGTTSPELADQIHPICKEFEAHPHPFVKLHGLLARTTAGWTNRMGQPLPEAERVARLSKMHSTSLELMKAELQAGRSENAYTIVSLLQSLSNHIKHHAPADVLKANMELGEAIVALGINNAIAIGEMAVPWDDESAVRAIALLKKVDPQLRQTRDDVEEIEEKFPNAADPAEPGAPAVWEIGGFADLFHGDETLQIDAVRERWAYCWGTRLNAIVPFKVNIDSGEAVLFGSSDNPLIGGPERLLLSGSPVRLLSSLGQTEYFVIASSGLNAVLLKDGTRRLVTPANALPKSPTALVHSGDWLILGTATGVLARIDLKTGRVEEIANMSRPVAESALDGIGEFKVNFLAQDTARERVIVGLNTGNNPIPEVSLWRLDPKSKEVSRIVQFGPPRGGPLSGIVFGDELIVSDTWLLRWNLRNDQRTLIANYTCGELQPQMKLWLGFVKGPVLCGGRIWFSGYDRGFREFIPNESPKLHRVHGTTPGNPLVSVYKAPDLVPVDEETFLFCYGRRIFGVRPEGKAGKQP